MATMERDLVAAVSAPDPTFARWAEAGLVWLPERGMGYYPVCEQPYDAAYFAKYEGYAKTDLGRALTKARLDLVSRHISSGASVVDIGIGSGAFLQELRWLRAAGGGYDINPAGVHWLNQRGWFCDPRREKVDALTFWDSLEHIPNVAEFVASARAWVFCSLPIFSGPGDVLRSRHFRRSEHCWYWTRNGLTDWMAEQGLRCVEHSTVETALGRESIETFAFRRVA